MLLKFLAVFRTLLRRRHGRRLAGVENKSGGAGQSPAAGDARPSNTTALVFWIALTGDIFFVLARC